MADGSDLGIRGSSVTVVCDRYHVIATIAVAKATILTIRNGFRVIAAYLVFVKGEKVPPGLVPAIGDGCHRMSDNRCRASCL